MGLWRGTAFGAALLAMLCAGPLLRAQAPTLAEQRDRLDATRKAAENAQARSRALERQADAARNQAARAHALMAAATARIEAAQARMAEARQRIALIDRQLGEQRVRLAGRQDSVARLIAALQSLARRPAVLGVAQPGSTADLVHVRAVLGTVVPVVEQRTADVRAEIERIKALRAQADAAVEELRQGRVRLESERIGLVRLEAEQSLRSRALDRGAMVESDRALALGEHARDLVDDMRVTRDAAETRRALQALPGPLPRPGSSVQDDARAVRAPYRLPVAGRVVTGTGELSETGVRARGLTLVTAPGAAVLAPAAGRIVYAERFRGYGDIVILDHGGGWTSLLTGLGAITVRQGAHVTAGQAIGRTRTGEEPRITVELRRRGRPMDVTAFLY